MASGKLTSANHHPGYLVFETIAFISTVGFLVVFVALIVANRSSQKDDGSQE